MNKIVIVVKDGAVHLVGDTDRSHLLHRVLFGDLCNALSDILPPHIGILLGPTTLQGVDRHLLRWISG